MAMLGLRAILWHQDESDSLALTSPETYATRLKSVKLNSEPMPSWYWEWVCVLVNNQPIPANGDLYCHRMRA
jgi:hypothetical protein